MKKLIFTLSFFALFITVQAQQYARVKIDLTKADLSTVAALGLECDHGHHAPHRHLINDFTYEELAQLDAHNIPYQILQANAAQWYAARLRKPHSQEHVQTAVREAGCMSGTSSVEYFEPPVNYEQGSMGGYLTYEELLATLDKMHEMYPHLITAKAEIDTFRTYEGRPLHWVSISDNPENNDEGEPAILYNSLHHAREAASLSQLVFYMWYLLENYETDERVKYLVDNTHMYFIPCLNPDGYVYNQTTSPDGGGLWRKNRFLSADGQHGVDLNRNYGYQWGSDDEGSSPVTNSETYRGTGPFSEIETQAMRKFLIDHEVQIALNNHSFSNLLIRPKLEQGSEFDIYGGFGAVLTSENNYVFGDDLTTVGYAVNGDSDSWMFFDQTVKDKIYAMTPEVGPANTGFWPSQADLPAIHQSMMQLNLTAPNLLHNFIDYVDKNERILFEVSGNLEFDLVQYGLKPETTTVTLTSLNDNVTLEDTSRELDLEITETSNQLWSYEAEPTMGVLQEEIKFEVTIADADMEGYTRRDTITKTIIYGELSTPLVDAGEDLSGWEDSTWGVDESTFVSAPSCISDSPNGNYASNANSVIQNINSIDLSNAELAFLEFSAKWDIENDFDYVQVQVREEGESDWTALCGSYTNMGTVNQAEGEPLYDGTQSDWVVESMPLEDYLGKKIDLRFVLVSDGFVVADGFYFDDLAVKAITNTTSSTADLQASLSDLKLSPNPALNRLNIQFQQQHTNSDINISIYNAQGQVLLAQQNTIASKGRHSISLDIDQLPTGMYFVSLADQYGNVQTSKLIKQ